MKMQNNTVLITGGASGIGLELVKQLSGLNNTVLITGRDLAKLENAKRLFPQLHIYQSDVSDPNAITALYERVTKDFPELNILINNAGVMKEINFHDADDNLLELTKEIDINFTGPVRMAKKFLPHLKKKTSAAIVNVSSGLAFTPLPMSPVYCATKAAMHSFSLSLRVQLKKTNVKVFELAPPATQTELLGEFDAEDMKGISIMAVDKMVECAIEGMKKDQLEIRPGQSNQLKFMSRVAPQFILNQMSKPVDRMLEKQKH